MPFHYGGRFNQGLYDNQSFHNQNSAKGNNQNNQRFWQNKQNQGHQGGNQSWNHNRTNNYNHNHNNNRRNHHHNRQHWQSWRTRHQNQNQNHHQNQQKNIPFHKQFQAFPNSNSQQRSWTEPDNSSSSNSPSTAWGNTQSPFSHGDLNSLQRGQHNTFSGVSRDSHGDVVMADAPQMTTFSFRDHAEDLRTGAKRMMECASDLEGLASFMNSINQSFSPNEQFGNGVYYYD